LTSPEQQERRQSLKISFSQPNIMKKSVSMGLGFPGFHQAAAASAKVTFYALLGKGIYCLCIRQALLK
jgi:hypothetical protein